MIDNARKGSFGHLASPASYTSNEDSIPEKLYKIIFDLAADYIMKPFPPEGDYSSHVLGQARSVCYSFQVIRNLPSRAFERSSIAEGFVRIWRNGFKWAQCLRLAIAHMHKYDLDDAGKEFCGEFAAGISALLEAVAKYEQTTEETVLDKKVYDFVAELWAARNVIQVVAKEAAKAMSALDDLEDKDRGSLVDAVETHFDSLHEVAALAMNRARDALCDMDFDAITAHYGVLYLFTVEIRWSSIRDAILNEDLASFLLDSMSVFLDASYRSLDDRYDSLMLCIRMISSVYSITSSTASYISHGFQHGLVDIFLKIGQIYNSIDKGDRMPISNMLRRRIPAFMLLKSVLQATRQDMTTVSGKLDHKPFNISLLKGDFKGIWRDFEIVILEHSILRRVHALEIQRDHVYCSNVSLSMCPPLSPRLIGVIKSVCDTKGPPHIFKRCSGCKHAIYCSETCQKSSWETSHSLECKDMKKEKCTILF